MACLVRHKWRGEVGGREMTHPGAWAATSSTGRARKRTGGHNVQLSILSAVSTMPMWLEPYLVRDGIQQQHHVLALYTLQVEPQRAI